MGSKQLRQRYDMTCTTAFSEWPSRYACGDPDRHHGHGGSSVIHFGIHLTLSGRHVLRPHDD